MYATGTGHFIEDILPVPVPLQILRSFLLVSVKCVIKDDSKRLFAMSVFRVTLLLLYILFVNQNINFESYIEQRFILRYLIDVDYQLLKTFILTVITYCVKSIN